MNALTDMGIEERILIYAPTGKDGELTCKVLGAADLECVACRSAEQLLTELKSGAGGLLLVEETLTAQFVDRLMRSLTDQPSWSDLPILLLTSAGANSPALDYPIQSLGNVTLLERPVRTLALVSAVGSALRARKRQYGLREAERRKDEFLASLGHELRNPLAPIRTSMAILDRLYPDSREVAKVYDIVERQVTHLTRLIDDLLDVARITRGKVTLQRAPTSVAAIVNQAVEMCAALADAAGHTVRVSLPTDQVTLVADHARLVQSVANVLANAIKFTPKSGEISIDATLTNGNVTIGVKDPGIGLPTSAMLKIFDLFEQGDAGPGRIKGGLGIGLSLARQFVEMHGGSIHAESEGVGRGTLFTLIIPREAQTKASRPRASLIARSALVDSRPTKVLVVDDNLDSAEVLAILFRCDGFTVASANGGEQAIDEAARFEPDVVVMDLGMPGVDGYEAARRMRTRPGGRERVLIALTGWGQEGTRKKALEAGFDFHLVKPVDFEVLKSYIAQS